MPSNHLILCCPLLPSIFPSVISSNESALHIRWPKYWSFSFSFSPSNEYSDLISFRIDWFDLLAAKGLPRVFFSTTVLRHQFFTYQLAFLRNCQTVFQSGSILHSYQHCQSSNFSISLPNLVISHLVEWLVCFFKIVDILMGMKWYLIIILICMALMSSDIVQLFMCLKTIYISSLKKYLILFSHFKIE